MKFSVVLIAAIAAIAGLGAAAPDGCADSINGNFEITPISSIYEKRDLSARAASCGSGSTLVLSLADGVLTDSLGRIGYVASNSQLQFDNPPQSGSLMVSGFSICKNGTLALGQTAIWRRCRSGNFYNLYFSNDAAQCEEVHLGVIVCGQGADDVPVPRGADVATTVIQVVSNGQLSAVSTEIPIPICQISDGQVQAHLVPCADIHLPTVTLGVPPSATLPAVPAISDTATATTLIATTGLVGTTTETLVVPPASTPTQIPSGPQGPTGTRPAAPTEAPPAGGGAVVPAASGSGLILVFGIFIWGFLA